MEKYDYDYYREHFKDKFIKLLDCKYNAEKARARRGLFIGEFEKRYNHDLGETIKNWFKTNELQRAVPSMDVLIKICNFFDCDLDYFFTKQNVFRSTFNHASQYIGLDYETVERLSKYSPEEKEILNVTIYKNHVNSNNPILKNSDYFKTLIESVEKYSISSHTKIITITDSLTGKKEELSRKTDNTRMEAIHREEARKDLETLLDCVYTEYFTATMKMKDDKIEELKKKLKGSD